MSSESVLRDLVFVLAVVIVLVVLRGLRAKRLGRRRRRPRQSPSPSPVPVALSADALSVLQLVAERRGESVSFQQVRELLGTSPRKTAEVIDELRRPQLVDWFGESAALGSHGYATARGREYLASSAGGL